jgi:hypothetical protein
MLMSIFTPGVSPERQNTFLAGIAFYQLGEDRRHPSTLPVGRRMSTGMITMG